MALDPDWVQQILKYEVTLEPAAEEMQGVDCWKCEGDIPHTHVDTDSGRVGRSWIDGALGEVRRATTGTLSRRSRANTGTTGSTSTCGTSSSWRNR